MNRSLITLAFFALLLAACSGGEVSDAGPADTEATASETTAPDSAVTEDTTITEDTFPDSDETA
ncbi:MAG: hypothetical protein ABFR53_03095, partial [Actinomycetota bacterium]